MDERYLHLNRHGVLAVPGALMAIMAYLLRYWLVALLMVTLMRRSPEAASWFYHSVSWGLLILQAPMLLLAYAAGARQPSAGLWPRWAWRHGVAIVSVTVVLNLAWATHFLMGRAVWEPWPERAVLVAALIELGIGVGIWRNAYYRQIFQEFPAQLGAAVASQHTPKVTP